MRRLQPLVQGQPQDHPGLDSFGHEIGLHYEAERYCGANGKQHLLSDLRLLEDLSGHKIVSASQHIPIESGRIALSDFIRNEAYEPRFTEHPMSYISDSLMVWRQATPHDLLDARASFQFLSHPDTWMSDYASMEEALSDIMEQEIESVRARYAELARHYRRFCWSAANSTSASACVEPTLPCN